MGRASRGMPSRLGEKLRQVRVALGLSQEMMLTRLGAPDTILQTSISKYERRQTEPPVLVLLRYADVANVWMEVLVRDELDLPEVLPSPTKHEGIPRSGKQSKRLQVKIQK